MCVSPREIDPIHSTAHFRGKTWLQHTHTHIHTGTHQRHTEIASDTDIPTKRLTCPRSSRLLPLLIFGIWKNDTGIDEAECRLFDALTDISKSICRWDNKGLCRSRIFFSFVLFMLWMNKWKLKVDIQIWVCILYDLILNLEMHFIIDVMRDFSFGGENALK